VSGLARHIPNLLTGLRLALAPAVALFLISGYDRAALGTFAIAGLSDAADGFLAKRFGLATRFGRYLDPAADKLLMLASYVTLTMLHVAPLGLTAIVVGRDIAIVLGVIAVVTLELPLRVAPIALGKLSTAVQIGYVAFALLALSFDLAWPQVLQYAALATAVVTILSWAGYASLLVRALRARAAASR
jgi:cardiolipin synthase